MSENSTLSASEFGIEDAIYKEIKKLTIAQSAVLGGRLALRILPIVTEYIEINQENLALAAFRLNLFCFISNWHKLLGSTAMASDANRYVKKLGDSTGAAAALGAAALASQIRLGQRDIDGLGMIGRLGMAAAHKCGGDLASRQVYSSLIDDLEFVRKNRGRNIMDESLWLADVRGNQKYKANFPAWARTKFDKIAQNNDALYQRWHLYVEWYRSLLPNSTTSQVKSLFDKEKSFRIYHMPIDFWGRDSDAVLRDLKSIIGESSGNASSKLVDHPVPHDEPRFPDRRFLDHVEEASRTLPRQKIAPINIKAVNERVIASGFEHSLDDGKERDIQRWYAPLLAHVQNELKSNFRQGTNHSHIRERLITLRDVLKLPMHIIEEKQFELGYATRRFRRILNVYQNNQSDMPVLSQNIWEDLDELCNSLEIGLSKFVPWRRFVIEIEGVPPDPTLPLGSEIAKRMEPIIDVMEQEPKYFDPEIPRTFRFLSEAAKDPDGVGRLAIYGLIRSAENLMIGTSNLFLGMIKGAIKNASEIIASKAAIVFATFLVSGISAIVGLAPGLGPWLTSIRLIAQRMIE